MKKIMVATPAYGGKVFLEYMSSYTSSIFPALNAGFQLTHVGIGNESHVGRARNSLASIAIHHDFDVLFFIDADQSWSPDQLVKVLSSEKLITGGTTPKKALPIEMSCGIPGISDYSMESLMAYADGRTEFEAKYVPPVFLKIDISVLKELSKHLPQYDHRGMKCWDFFPSGYNPDVGNFESEDWGFCSLAQKYGFKTYLNMNGIVNHTGNYCFNPNQIMSAYRRV